MFTVSLLTWLALTVMLFLCTFKKFPLSFGKLTTIFGQMLSSIHCRKEHHKSSITISPEIYKNSCHNQQVKSKKPLKKRLN